MEFTFIRIGLQMIQHDFAAFAGVGDLTGGFCRQSIFAQLPVDVA